MRPEATEVTPEARRPERGRLISAPLALSAADRGRALPSPRVARAASGCRSRPVWSRRPDLVPAAKAKVALHACAPARPRSGRTGLPWRRGRDTSRCRVAAVRTRSEARREPLTKDAAPADEPVVGDADGSGVGGTGKARRWAKVSLPLLLLALIGSVAASAFAFSHVRPRRCSTARF